MSIHLVRDVRRGARLPKPFKIGPERVVVTEVDGKHVTTVERQRTALILRGRGYRAVESPADPPNTGSKPAAGPVGRDVVEEVERKRKEEAVEAPPKRTSAEIKAAAKELGIKGRSKMDADALLAAVEQAEAELEE